MTACIVQVCMRSLRFACVLRLRNQKSWSRREADLEVRFSGCWRPVENLAWGSEQGQRFSRVVGAPISAPYSGIRTWVSLRRRYLGGGRLSQKESDSDL